MTLPYDVPGLKVVLAQPSQMSCWATVFTMMKSWKDQASYDIRMAIAVVGHQYLEYFDNDTGLPASQFDDFLAAASMTHDPMMNLTIDGWENNLRNHGLIWVGTLASPSHVSGLHSRIIQGMWGDGTPAGTIMKMIDPAGGQEYDESFNVFIQKYEDAFRLTGKDDYYQIRRFL